MVTHFTQFTIGHAHLGAYAFLSFTLFGAIYYMMPRITGRRWPWPAMIPVHFWLVVIGFIVYFVSLSIGGIYQGLAMLDATKPFADSEIGRASCRERVCQYVKISVVAVSLKKKKKTHYHC